MLQIGNKINYAPQDSAHFIIHGNTYPSYGLENKHATTTKKNTVVGGKI